MKPRFNWRAGLAFVHDVCAAALAWKVPEGWIVEKPSSLQLLGNYMGTALGPIGVYSARAAP